MLILRRRSCTERAELKSHQAAQRFGWGRAGSHAEQGKVVPSPSSPALLGSQPACPIPWAPAWAWEVPAGAVALVVSASAPPTVVSDVGPGGLKRSAHVLRTQLMGPGEAPELRGRPRRRLRRIDSLLIAARERPSWAGV